MGSVKRGTVGPLIAQGVVDVKEGGIREAICVEGVIGGGIASLPPRSEKGCAIGVPQVRGSTINARGRRVTVCITAGVVVPRGTPRREGTGSPIDAKRDAPCLSLGGLFTSVGRVPSLGALRRTKGGEVTVETGLRSAALDGKGEDIRHLRRQGYTRKAIVKRQTGPKTEAQDNVGIRRGQ